MGTLLFPHLRTFKYGDNTVSTALIYREGEISLVIVGDIDSQKLEYNLISGMEYEYAYLLERVSSPNIIENKISSHSNETAFNAGRLLQKDIMKRFFHILSEVYNYLTTRFGLLYPYEGSKHEEYFLHWIEEEGLFKRKIHKYWAPVKGLGQAWSSTIQIDDSSIVSLSDEILDLHGNKQHRAVDELKSKIVQYVNSL